MSSTPETTPAVVPAAPATPAASPVGNIIRTKRHGCFALAENVFGQYAIRCDDPLANVDVITKEQFGQFRLNPNMPKIPAGLWLRWVRLAKYYAGLTTDLEVGVNLLLSNDLTTWRIFVYPQAVSGASVNASSFDGSIDIETGEVIEHWPPEGWMPVGTSHSHNSMQAFYSGTDDRSELSIPGLHIVIGSMRPSHNTYSIVSSVTGDGRRFGLAHDEMIDMNPPEDHEKYTYHQSCLGIINAGYGSTKYGGTYRGIGPSSTGWQQRRNQLDMWTPDGTEEDRSYKGGGTGRGLASTISEPATRKKLDVADIWSGFEGLRRFCQMLDEVTSSHTELLDSANDALTLIGMRVDALANFQEPGTATSTTGEEIELVYEIIDNTIDKIEGFEPRLSAAESRARLNARASTSTRTAKPAKPVQPKARRTRRNGKASVAEAAAADRAAMAAEARSASNGLLVAQAKGLVGADGTTPLSSEPAGALAPVVTAPPTAVVGPPTAGAAPKPAPAGNSLATSTAAPKGTPPGAPPAAAPVAATPVIAAAPAAATPAAAPSSSEIPF